MLTNLTILLLKPTQRLYASLHTSQASHFGQHEVYDQNNLHDKEVD